MAIHLDDIENRAYSPFSDDDDSDSLESSLDEFDFEDDVETREGMIARLAASFMSVKELLIWVICCPTAVVTTKQLLAVHGFHYPLTLSFVYFVAIAVTHITVSICRGLHQIWYRAQDIDSKQNLRQSLRQLILDCFLPEGYWIANLPSALAAAASLPLLLQSVLHMPSLPVLVMIFPLIYATERLIVFLYDAIVWQKKGNPWDCVVAISACGIMLYYDNRLMVPGLVFGVSGIMLLGISRACFNIGRETCSVLDAQKGLHGFVMMTLVIGGATSGMLAYCVERIHLSSTIPHTTFLTMVLNVAAMIGTFFPRTSMIPSSISTIEGRADRDALRPNLIASAGFSVLILAAALFSNPPQYVRGMQIAAYLTSIVFLLGIDRICAHTLIFFNAKSFSSKDTTEIPPTVSHLITKCLLALIIAGISSVFSFTSTASINTLPIGPPTNYDRSYNPASRFDIVVSMYDEDPISVKRMLDQITSTTLLQYLNLNGHKPRITIYNKNPSISLPALQNITGADTVKRLPNTGREGGTYLSHIVNEWEFLAEQTMFIQAHAHNMRELIPRINDYLVRDTGMLSLGFTGVTCPCGNCSDRWGWEDSDIIPSIYENVYNQTCIPSQQILLSYKGQFVASARRIRGVKKSVYEDLLRAVTNEEGWSHDMNEEKTEKQDPSNPTFGFTMERMWSLVMQCATDERMAARCPSLLSGKGIGGLVQDCQCIDTI